MSSARLVIVLLFVVALCMSGCAATRQADTRSASEVFLDAVISLFEPDDYEAQNQKIADKRRQWQCDNLSVSELQKLGVTK